MRPCGRRVGGLLGGLAGHGQTLCLDLCCFCCHDCQTLLFGLLCHPTFGCDLTLRERLTGPSRGQSLLFAPLCLPAVRGEGLLRDPAVLLVDRDQALAQVDQRPLQPAAQRLQPLQRFLQFGFGLPQLGFLGRQLFFGGAGQRVQ